MSCMVTTHDSTSPSSERMGVALSSAATLRPSGTLRTISSARTVSPAASDSDSGHSLSETSRPSAHRTVIVSSSCSSVSSGSLRASPMRSISRLKDTGAPVGASKTATATGEVSTSVSSHALERRSSRYLRALAMTIAAWEANIVSVSSSSRLNSWPGSLFAMWMLPISSPRWRMGTVRNALMGVGGRKSGRPRERTWLAKSETRRGPGRVLRYWKNSMPPGMAHRPCASSGERPEARKSLRLPDSSSVVITP